MCIHGYLLSFSHSGEKKTKKVSRLEVVLQLSLRNLPGTAWVNRSQLHHYIMQPVGWRNNTAAPCELLGLLPDSSQGIS